MRETFSSTAAARSPTFFETLRLSYGSSETPPSRVKNQTLASSGSGSGAT
jgi:hypothetical protein